MLLGSRLGNLAMAVAVCWLKSSEGQRPGETMLIAPIAASVFAPRKVFVCFAAGICPRLLGPFSSIGGLRWTAAAVGEAI